jgi:hypothetical protein
MCWLKLRAKGAGDSRVGKRLTWRMRGLQDPICLFRICNQLSVPLDLQMSRCPFEERRARELVHVQLWLGGHCGAGHRLEDTVKWKRSDAGRAGSAECTGYRWQKENEKDQRKEQCSRKKRETVRHLRKEKEKKGKVINKLLLITIRISIRSNMCTVWRPRSP